MEEFKTGDETDGEKGYLPEGEALELIPVKKDRREL